MNTQNFGKCLVAVAGMSLFLAGTRVDAEVELSEYAFSQDGTITVRPSPAPGGSSFDTTTGLGTVRMMFTGAGSHYGLLFVDHDLSGSINTFFNEVGTTSAGSPPAGLSWEIDEPGFVFGDIFDHFLFNTLENSIGTAGPEDIALAMGWNFSLQPGEVGVIDFFLTTTEPSGFYLHHFDPDSRENVYLSSSLTIRALEVPEGSTVLVQRESPLGSLN